jgi:multidrug resistance protein MdtO
MNHGDTQPASAPDKNRSRLWFGTGLALVPGRLSFRDFPGRRVAAFRLFIVALTIALVNAKPCTCPP